MPAPLRGLPVLLGGVPALLGGVPAALAGMGELAAGVPWPPGKVLAGAVGPLGAVSEALCEVMVAVGEGVGPPSVGEGFEPIVEAGVPGGEAVVSGGEAAVPGGVVVKGEGPAPLEDVGELLVELLAPVAEGCDPAGGVVWPPGG